MLKGRGDSVPLVLLAAATTTAAAVAVGSLLALAAIPNKEQQSSGGGRKPEESSYWNRLSIRIKCWILRIGRVDQKFIVLLPTTREEKEETGTPGSNTGGRGSPSSLGKQEVEQPYTLLIIFPGRYMQPQDYVAIGKVIQEQAANNNQIQNNEYARKLIVGIGVDPNWSFSGLIKWALNGNDPNILANLIIQKAGRAVVQQKGTNKETAAGRLEEVYNPLMKSKIFGDFFLWGHSVGGLHAIQAAYPSKYKGLLLYGCSLSLAGANKSLASYPRPVLTMMGELDGHLRFYRVAKESQLLKEDLECKLKCSSQTDQIKRMARLRKPIIVLPELNHMQIGMDKMPQITRLTGRSDFVSHVSLNQAHNTIAGVVLDFLLVHSTTTNSNSSSMTTIKEAENRLLDLGRTTQTVYLQPWLQLTNPTYQCRFLCDIQRQLLHVTADDGRHPFFFYEDQDEDNLDESSSRRLEDPSHDMIDIVPQWLGSQTNDFLYSRPNWNPDTNQILLQVVEQQVIAIGHGFLVPQLCKTLAFKGRSQEEILFNQNKYQEIKDSPAPTLMELNQQTFDRVLHHSQLITPTQRRRYLTTGKKLRFGPDIYVPVAPQWVQQPVSITRLADGPENDFYYLWQSTYTTTSLSVPPPYGGAWYGKPLSPAQAYEWIVFDAFKP